MSRMEIVGINGQLLQCSEVSSSVPQGLVFGFMLFKLFISDLALGVSSVVFPSVDDTELFKTL